MNYVLGSIFWIFWIMWFFPWKYKYRCIRVYVWFKDDKHVIWMWIWLILKNISLLDRIWSLWLVCFDHSPPNVIFWLGRLIFSVSINSHPDNIYLSLLYKATFSYPILYLSFTWQHCLILSFISPLQCNIFIFNPLSLLYKATFSYSILYLSFTWQHCLILSFISPLQGNIFISNPLSLLYKATDITLWNICVTNDHRYVPLVANTSRFFPHSWLITGFVTRLTQWVPLVEQELLTLLEHLSSPPVFSGVHVTRSSVLCVCFVDHCLSFCTFSFGHGVVCSSLIYGFWLRLWYLQALLSYPILYLDPLEGNIFIYIPYYLIINNFKGLNVGVLACRPRYTMIFKLILFIFQTLYLLVSRLSIHLNTLFNHQIF